MHSDGVVLSDWKYGFFWYSGWVTTRLYIMRMYGVMMRLELRRVIGYLGRGKGEKLHPTRAFWFKVCICGLNEAYTMIYSNILNEWYHFWLCVELLLVFVLIDVNYMKVSCHAMLALQLQLIAKNNSSPSCEVKYVTSCNSITRVSSKIFSLWACRDSNPITIGRIYHVARF